ncbi:MAG TPA: adenylate/guanylate cyclase domain-containing protein [Chloroflexota bacterium]|jgi:adenylate cyclase|nr:adenylate/guanylate cyclase domain-containing protein [Chloroflexota bacterium]
MIQRWRLGTGLVLLAYVATHLLNHALGLISLGAAEAGRSWFTAVWRFPPLTAVLYGSLLVHIALVLWALYRRRTLRLPPGEWVRLLLGLALPVQLLGHVFGTRVAHEAFGVSDTYSRLLVELWVDEPLGALLQTGLLVTAWAHGWLGLYFWARASPRWQPLLEPLRVVGGLLPLLALVGFVAMGREVRVLAQDPAWVARVAPPLAPGAAAQLDSWRDRAVGLFVGSVGLTLLARWGRGRWRRRTDWPRVTYPDGRSVLVEPGASVLEASRLLGVPHLALCGGRARCSTCRVRVGAGLADLPPPGPAERRVLARINAPPNVRLACQTRPTRDVDVFPLLAPQQVSPALLRPSRGASGAEQEVVVLFADMRGFTRFAERRLPYDVVFLLNQWHDTLGRAIERAGGQPNQFIGDGIMALFGVASGWTTGCRQALQAAAAIGRAVEELNRVLASELPEPLRVAMGIHGGQVIVGEMGYGRARYLTAIGDAVNTASRLETLAKERGCQLVVSESVAAAANVDLGYFPLEEVQVRGRVASVRVRLVDEALALEALLPRPAAPLTLAPQAS